MSKYKIAYKVAEYGQADIYVVIDMPSGEVRSKHVSFAEARAAVHRYESADAKRRYLRDIA